MNVSSSVSPENRFKEYLLEVVSIVSETKKPVALKDLAVRFPEVEDSTIYSRADACAKRGWLTITKTLDGYKAVTPTLKGFRIIGEAPFEVEQKEVPEIKEPRYVYLVTATFEDKAPVRFVSDREYSEVLSMLGGLEETSSLYIEKKVIV